MRAQWYVSVAALKRGHTSYDTLRLWNNHFMKLCIDELCINEIMFLFWFISISLLLKLMLRSQMIQRCDLFLSCAQWARAVKSDASDLIDFLPFELRKIEFSLKPLLNSQKIFHYSLGPAERSLMLADETFLLLFICFCCMLRKLKTQFLSRLSVRVSKNRET